ncbi:MAG: hypothetical protein E6K46_01915 [Gammaproteobacteria bacterium]|nr:MAG: hypothetical protein E6K46_01915 [Gammaproteobacteria bacterium]
MNLRQLLRALIARRRVFFVALGAVVLAATLASLMMSKSYRATVSLLVDTRDEQSLGDALRPLVLPQEHMSYLQTQVDILTSPKVARAVAQELRLEETPGALAALGWAAAIANAYAQAYVDTMLELRVAPTRKAAAWFDEQLKGLRANLEDAQAKLAHAKLAVQAKATQHPESIPRVVDNAFVQQLKGELLHGEEKLQELTTQYGVNHPVYRRQISENQTLRTRLQAEMRKLAAGAAAAGVDAAPDDALKAGVQGPQAPDEAVLVRNVQSAERAYETAMQRYVVSQVDSRASQTNVEVLNPAVAPLKPYRPNIALNIALSLFTGVVLGGILVALLETQDARVRSPEDLQSASRVPVLAVIGEEGKRGARLLLSPPATVLRALPRPQ